MTLDELKETLDNLPKEYSDYEVVFGETAYGEPINIIEELGGQIIIGAF